MYIVINRENKEEFEFDYAPPARRKLVELCGQGISAYMIIDKHYMLHSFTVIEPDDDDD
jgi:hypothetical protein